MVHPLPLYTALNSGVRGSQNHQDYGGDYLTSYYLLLPADRRFDKQGHNRNRIPEFLQP
jgi:hypothetical protein